MTEATATQAAAALPAPSLTIDGQDGAWSGPVAAKQIAWAVGKMGVADGLAPAILPKVVAAVNLVSAHLQPHGLTIVVDQSLMAKSLPFFIFVALVAAHDYAKTKTKAPWL